MAAFRLAAEMGADGVELDVQLCKDGEAVVIHNASLEGTTDGSGQVKDFTLAELQRLDAGCWYTAQFAGERIPTLAQVLHEFGPRLMLNIELKGTTLLSNELEAEVVRLIKDATVQQALKDHNFNFGTRAIGRSGAPPRDLADHRATQGVASARGVWREGGRPGHVSHRADRTLCPTEAVSTVHRQYPPPGGGPPRTGDHGRSSRRHERRPC